MKKLIFYASYTSQKILVGSGLHRDPLVRGTDPKIRVRTKVSQIRNTDAWHSLEFWF
jgi:hypothetical protein